MIFTKISLVFLKPWIYDDDREIVTAQKPFQKGWTENMRKKSHISLARYIVANTEDEGLKNTGCRFILEVSCRIVSHLFIYKRHEITGTFPKLRKDIDALIHGKENRFPKRKRMYYMNLGEITHYVADYFTFPHNKIYPGGFKEHCAYEEHLKHELRALFKDGGTEGVE